MDHESLDPPTANTLQQSMNEPNIPDDPPNTNNERIIPINISPKPFAKFKSPMQCQHIRPEETTLEPSNNNDYYKKVYDIIGSNNNGDGEDPQQPQCLPVTLDDGSITETPGSIRDIEIDINFSNNSPNEKSKYLRRPNNNDSVHDHNENLQCQNLNKSSDILPYADADLYFMDDDDTINEKDCQVIIEEIEPTTLERKQLNEEFIANTKENDINIINTGISEEPNGRSTLNRNIHHKIHLVPIKLDDGMVIQKNKEEVTERKSEFTKYSHQEFIDNDSMKEIRRFDVDTKTQNMPAEAPKTFVKERVIPIMLENTGKTITPSFTKLEDPQPPEWSAFSQRNKLNAKETVVPIRLVDIADEESASVAGSEYENAPKNRQYDLPSSKWASNIDEPIRREETGTRPKDKTAATNSPDSIINPKPVRLDDIGGASGLSEKENGFGDSVNNKRFGQKSNKDKPSIPPKPPKSPAIKSSKSETTTDTKKVLSKTTETMKTTTEKRSRTVQFNLDDDHEDKDADSQTNPFATNGKKSKVENSRMRHKPPPYGSSYRSNSADGGTNIRDGQPKMGSRTYPNNAARDDPSSRGRARSKSGPFYRAYPTADGTKVEYSNDDDKALQEIDKDITRIWRELQELDGMAPGRFEEKPNTPTQRKHSGDREYPQSKPYVYSNGNSEPKPKLETVTVREFTMPTPVSASPTRIRSTSSSSHHTESYKETAKDTPIKTSKADADRKQRTIWDMDCSEPLDPNHIPNYSTPSRRSRDTQRSGLIKPTWNPKRRSLSGSRNTYDELAKNGNSKMSTSLIQESSIPSQAFATPFGTNITPTPIRRSQMSARQSPSPQRPLSSSFIPSVSSLHPDEKKSNRSDMNNKKPSLPIEKSVQPLQLSKHDSIAYADEDFKDCMDDLSSPSLTKNNGVNTACTSTHINPNKTKDVNLSYASSKQNTANSVAIQTGQSSDASTQTMNEGDMKSSKSSKSSCVIS